MNLEEIFAQPVANANASKPKAETVTAADGHTYHKSSSANATEAPTNAGTLEKAKERQAELVQGLDYPQTEFVLMCQMYFDIYGVLISAETATERYGITAEQYDEYFNAEVVQQALTANGVIQPEPVERLLPKGSVLTPKQIVVANVMMDLLDTRADKKKLQDNDCSTLEWSRWLRQPAFQKYIQEKGESVLQTGQHEAALALMDRVRAGDAKSIAFYYEYLGKFVSKSSSGTTVNVTSGGDLQFIVTHLLEIIIDEVEDGPTAIRIADRIKNMIGANNVANQIIGEPHAIVEPPTAAMRDQTDVIKAIEARAGVMD